MQAADLHRLDTLLRDHPEIATERIDDAQESREALHVATDWPGRRPAVGAVIGRLVAAGARVDANFRGPHAETPSAPTNDAIASSQSSPGTVDWSRCIGGVTRRSGSG
jgi:hypothetical protein